MSDEQGLAVRAAGTGAGALLGYLLDPAGDLPALGAVVGAATSEMFIDLAGKVRAEWARKNTEVMEAAAPGGEAAQLELLRQVAEDPRLTAFAARIVDAVRYTADPVKLRAFGRLLAEGVAAGDRVDDLTMIVLTLQDLETPHVVTLKALAQYDAEQAAAVTTPLDRVVRADVSKLVERSGLSREGVQMALGTLTLRGLVVASTALGGPENPTGAVWTVTPAGVALIEALQAAGQH